MPMPLLKHRPPRRPPSAVVPQQRRTSPAAGATVLVIDDDPDVRELVTAQLGGEFVVLTAADGPSGLAAARTAQPDVIVLDVRMPQMTGFDVCERLREQQPTHVPVLMLTAYATLADIKLLGGAAGADNYLLKPYRRDDLIDRIRALLDSAS
jgi:two-component system OmpR family response regulator